MFHKISWVREIGVLVYLCARFCIRLHRWLLYGAERVRLWCCLWLVEYLLPPVGNARSRSPLPLFVACCTGVCVLCCGISFCLCVRHGRGAVALRVSVGLKCHGIEDLGVIEIQIYKQTSVQMYKYTNIQIYKCTKLRIYHADGPKARPRGRIHREISSSFEKSSLREAKDHSRRGPGSPEIVPEGYKAAPKGSQGREIGPAEAKK